MEGYQVAVGAIANRRCNQDELLSRALERRAAEDHQRQLEVAAGAGAVSNTVEVVPTTQY
jgi:hypothetical protein